MTIKGTPIERTYKLRTWEKGTGANSQSEIFTTLKNEKDMYEMIEGNMVNTNTHDYAVDEY
jgi:hypothetical protein